MDDGLLENQVLYTGFNEGLKDKPYLDTVNKLTLGYGYNVSARGIPSDWIPYIQDQLKNIQFPVKLLKSQLKTDVLYFYLKLQETFPWFDNLNDSRKMVLIDMCFMGFQKFIQFKKLISFLEKKDYESAAMEMLDSLWAKQVKGRATRSAEIMKIGNHQPIFNELHLN